MGAQLRQMHGLKYLTLVVQALFGLDNIFEELSPDFSRHLQLLLLLSVFQHNLSVLKYGDMGELTCLI
jgi:hypothetical protein